MNIIENFENILNKLGIDKKEKIYDSFFSYLIGSFRYSNIKINNNYQFGGGNLIFFHNNIRLDFAIVETSKEFIIKLHDNKYKLECISIVIEKAYKTASIKYITSKLDCITPKEYNIGTFLLEAAIMFLRKYKKEFNIDFITLVDEANIKCKNDTIILSQLKIMTSGHTWYSKPRHDIFCNKSCTNKNCIYREFGFIPYLTKPLEINNMNINNIRKNILIINDKLHKYPIILKIINKHINQTNISKYVVENMFNEYKNEPIWYFFKKLLINYDKYCILFNLIYQDIFAELKLSYFNNYKHYYLIQKIL